MAKRTNLDTLRLSIVAPYWYYPGKVIDYVLPLASTGFEIDAFVSSSSPIQSHDNLRIHQIGHIDLGRFVRLSSPYPIFLSLEEALKQAKPDVIDGQAFPFLTTIQAVRIARSLRKPSVVTIHGVFAKRNWQTNLLQHIYSRTFGSVLLRNATIVRCLTNEDAREIEALGCAREKIRVVPNFVDTDYFTPGKMEQEGLLVWTGRLVPEKGLYSLLSACRSVRRLGTNIRAELLGGGPMARELEATVEEQGLGGIVKLRGAQPRAEVLSALQRAQVFVFPSLKEGMSLSLLEAMACGKAIVASDIPSVRQLLIQNTSGLLVPPAKSEELGDAIQLLVDDEDLRIRLGTAARETVLNNYSIDSSVKALLEMYATAANSFGR